MKKNVYKRILLTEKSNLLKKTDTLLGDAFYFFGDAMTEEETDTLLEIEENIKRGCSSLGDYSKALHIFYDNFYIYGDTELNNRPTI